MEIFEVIGILVIGFVALLYKAQAPLMYIVYSTKGTFCTKHPYQRTIGKLRFNKGGKYKFFFGQ